MCKPRIHEFNVPILSLYSACSDQYILGMGGAVGLNDIAIGHAMDAYFEVEKEDKLELSLAVRSFFNQILSVKKEKT